MYNSKLLIFLIIICNSDPRLMTTLDVNKTKTIL